MQKSTVFCVRAPARSVVAASRSGWKCCCRVAVVGLFGAAVCTGCKPKEGPPPKAPKTAPLAEAVPAAPSGAQLPAGHPPIDGGSAPSQAAPAKLPPGHPPIDMPQAPPAAAGKPAVGGEVETLVGIKLTTPKGWIPLAPRASGGAFSVKPAAAFVLPRAKGDAEDATVRVTHFPGMKNVPVSAQLDRWYNQFVQPTGKPTKDVAITESYAIGGATVTVTDIPGTMRSGQGGGKANYRMIAAVIEHPKGPHFVKVVGPSATIDKWKDSIIAYVKSVQVIP